MGKKQKIVLLCIIFAFVTTGCGGKKANYATYNEIEKEKHSNQVILTISNEPTNGFDPCTGWGHDATPLIHSTLLEYNSEMELIYDLATDYSVSKDGLVWTFQIRDDVLFTDGTPLTTEDIAFSFETAKNSKSSVDFTYLERCNIIDAITIEFILKSPNSTFLNAIATMGIVPKHLYNETYAKNPVGSGPYIFVQWNQGEQLILKANQSYYREVPKMEKVVILFMDEDAAFLAAKAGQVDLALTSSTLATEQIEGMKLLSISSLDNRGFTLPVTPNIGEVTEDGHAIGNNVTSHLAIRKALAYGLDREKIAQDALNGFAQPAYSECDGMPWYNEDIKIEYNLEKAISLLEKDGWIDIDGDEIREKDGLKAEFTCVYPSGDSMRQACAMAAAAQAKQLGIKIIVEGTSWDAISKRMYSDAVLMGWGSANPRTSYMLFHSSNRLKTDYYNPENFNNKIVDHYLEKAISAHTIEEANQFFRLAQWDGTTGTSMLGDCPWIWFVNIDHLYYAKENLNIGKQPLHAHGASWPLLINLKEWYWE